MRVNPKQDVAFIKPVSDRGPKEVRGRHPWTAKPKQNGVATGQHINVMSQPIYRSGDGDSVCIAIPRVWRTA
jgi:hypothetical protein